MKTTDKNTRFRALKKIDIIMKEFENYAIEDFVRVPRMKSNEVTFAKSHRHTHFKLKSCTISLNDGVHNSRPLAEVL